MTTQPDRPSSNSGRVRSEDSMSRQALEEVLKQTAALNALTQDGDASCLEALLDVARRFPGMSFQLEPVLMELVRAALRAQAGRDFPADERFTAIVERVAHALFENPDTHARLSSFWQQLTTQI
jgi:hypothetical protein